MQPKTRTIADIELALIPDRQYRAESPIGTGTVWLVDMATGQIAVQFDLCYEARCQFLGAFNNGRSSWHGRTW